jgi:hypothetical protein
MSTYPPNASKGQAHMDDQQETPPTTTRPTKTELVARINQARQSLDQLIGPLSERQLDAAGPEGGWSVKEHLAHLAAWEQGIAALLQHRDRWQAMGLDRETVLAQDETGLNALIQERHHNRPVAEVMAAFRRAQQELSATLDALDDDALGHPYSAYDSTEIAEGGPAIVGWIIGNTYEHYEEHQGYIETLLGHSPR